MEYGNMEYEYGKPIKSFLFSHSQYVHHFVNTLKEQLCIQNAIEGFINDELVFSFFKLSVFCEIRFTFYSYIAFVEFVFVFSSFISTKNKLIEKKTQGVLNKNTTNRNDE